MKALHKVWGMVFAALLIFTLTAIISVFEQRDQAALIMLFILPIMFCSIFFGAKEGIFASALAFLSIDYFFTKPQFNFIPVTVPEAIPLITFMLTTLIIHWLINKHRTLEAEYNSCLRERLVAAETRKIQSSILNNLSHEIRTPLTSIVGFTDMVCSDSFAHVGSNELDKIRRSIRSNSSYLTRLIDRLIELSQSESGYVPLASNEVSAEHLRQELLSKYSIRAARKAIAFSIEVGKDVPATFMTDKLKLLALLEDLLDNAIKFTDKGAITLTISRSIGKVESLLSFRIEDSGIGIPKDALNQLFEPFHQSDISHSRTYGGAGIGLAHARKLARVLGGDLKLIDTIPAQGSCFEATITDSRAISA